MSNYIALIDAVYAAERAVAMTKSNLDETFRAWCEIRRQLQLKAARVKLGIDHWGGDEAGLSADGGHTKAKADHIFAQETLYAATKAANDTYIMGERDGEFPLW